MHGLWALPGKSATSPLRESMRADMHAFGNSREMQYGRHDGEICMNQGAGGWGLQRSIENICVYTYIYTI